jgi:hypothetical protein
MRHPLLKEERCVDTRFWKWKNTLGPHEALVGPDVGDKVELREPCREL